MRYSVSVISISIFLLSSKLFASHKVAMTWWDAFDIGLDAYAQDIAVDSSGNVYVTGYFKNGSDFDALTIKYNCPAFVPIKGDSCGKVGWIDVIDNGSYDYATGISASKRGYIYISGYSYKVHTV